MPFFIEYKTGCCKWIAGVVASAAMLNLAYAIEDAPPPPVAPGPEQRSTSIAALHSDFKFAWFSAPRVEGGSIAEALHAQARRIVGDLAAAGASLYPDAIGRVGRFDVYVADSKEVSAMSSATGRIALNAGFAELRPTDDWLALVIAREMGHVIAGHHSDNSMASIVTSVLMNLLVPGSGLIKSALSLAGSQLAAESGRVKQAAEADDIAMKLLEAAGYTPGVLALNLAVGPSESQLGKSSWAQAFGVSATNLVARFRSGRAAPSLAHAKPAVTEDKSAPAVPTDDAYARSPAVLLSPAEETIVVRTRPSGLPGPLILSGHLVPARRIE